MSEMEKATVVSGGRRVGLVAISVSTLSIVSLLCSIVMSSTTTLLVSDPDLYVVMLSLAVAGMCGSAVAGFVGGLAGLVLVFRAKSSSDTVLAVVATVLGATVVVAVVVMTLVGLTAV